MFGSGSIVIPVVGIFLVKSLLSYIRVGLRRRGLARRLGCKPVKTYQQYDKFLGLDFPLPKHQKLSGADVPGIMGAVSGKRLGERSSPGYWASACW